MCPSISNRMKRFFLFLANTCLDGLVFEGNYSPDEADQLGNLMLSVNGDYLLRKNDGALFRCPIGFQHFALDRYSTDSRFNINESSDKKTIVIGAAHAVWDIICFHTSSMMAILP